jgi:hypothetical protein
MQHIWDNIKKPFLQVIVIGDREEVQNKGSENIFNKNNMRKFQKY